MNIERQAVTAGVKRIAVTGTLGAVDDEDAVGRVLTDCVYTDQHWNPATREQAISDWEVWKFADEHLEVDITIIDPLYLYGPYVPGTKLTKGELESRSTPSVFYKGVLQPPGAEVYPPRHAHTCSRCGHCRRVHQAWTQADCDPNWSWRDAVGSPLHGRRRWRT
ncbi:hypothetical protein M0805_005939 [Coniferiporia weirii]|nr:hypothetical protein M0805_005939 [Coniferiporia weirii]